jgi:Uma2 family endonuclease
MASEPRPRLSIQEYLAFERQSEVKHDYLDGEIFAMSGASRRHNRIVLNVGSRLDSMLKARGCEVFVNEMRVRTPGTRFFTYPDVVVSCDEPKFDDAELDTFLNPVLIIEVLSRSTQDYDRGTKFDHYRSIPTLTEYVLVAQDRVHVEHHLHQASDGWLMNELDDLAQMLELSSVGCRLPLTDIYDRALGK